MKHQTLMNLVDKKTRLTSILLLLVTGIVEAFAQNANLPPVVDAAHGLPREIIATDGATMRRIPAGEFEMGDHFHEFKGSNRDELPVHTVYLDNFYLDTTPVTNAMYQEFMSATGHAAPTFWNDSRFNQPDQPVVGVSWYDAAAYCQWVGKRLPTEAQWEKAARGGRVGARYPWGDTITHDEANYWGTGGRDVWDGPSPVGSFPPNGYGLYDMAGNTTEWCLDEYDDGFYAKSPKENPVAGGLIRFMNDDFTTVQTRRVLRNWGWDGKSEYLRVSNRSFLSPAYKDSPEIGGFRCAMDWEAVVQSTAVSPQGKVTTTWGRIKGR